MKRNIAEMDALDIYISSLTDEELEIFKRKIGKREESMPLMSWDIFIEAFHKRIAEIKKRTELRQVLELAQKFKWKNDLEQAFAENDYEALVITDIHQKIMWVSDGFTSMTGYTKGFAMNKTPRFLQGEETLAATRSRIRAKIKSDKPFKEVIVNYRKDKTKYDCQVKIIPLYNKKTTHFIAFEKEVV